MLSWVFLGLGLLERSQNLIPYGDSIGEALDPWSKFFEFGMSKIAVSDAGCQNKIIIRLDDTDPVQSVKSNDALFLIDVCDFSKQHSYVLLVTKNFADWRRNLSRRQDRCRHLIEKRLKQMVIGAVDESNFGWRTLKRFGSGQTAETSTNDDYAGNSFLDACVIHKR